eukprot:1931956-Amphidinium_carterae.2
MPPRIKRLDADKRHCACWFCSNKHAELAVHSGTGQRHVLAKVEVPPAQDPNTIVHPPVPAPTYTEAVTAPTTILRPAGASAIVVPSQSCENPSHACRRAKQQAHTSPDALRQCALAAKVEIAAVQDPNTIVHPPVPAPTYTEAAIAPATIYTPEWIKQQIAHEKSLSAIRL